MPIDRLRARPAPPPNTALVLLTPLPTHRLQVRVSIVTSQTVTADRLGTVARILAAAAASAGLVAVAAVLAVEQFNRIVVTLSAALKHIVANLCRRLT